MEHDKQILNRDLQVKKLQYKELTQQIQQQARQQAQLNAQLNAQQQAQQQARQQALNAQLEQQQPRDETALNAKLAQAIKQLQEQYEQQTKYYQNYTILAKESQDQLLKKHQHDLEQCTKNLQHSDLEQCNKNLEQQTNLVKEQSRYIQQQQQLEKQQLESIAIQIQTKAHTAKLVEITKLCEQRYKVLQNENTELQTKYNDLDAELTTCNKALELHRGIMSNCDAGIKDVIQRVSGLTTLITSSSICDAEDLQEIKTEITEILDFFSTICKQTNKNNMLQSILTLTAENDNLIVINAINDNITNICDEYIEKMLNVSLDHQNYIKNSYMNTMDKLHKLVLTNNITGNILQDFNIIMQRSKDYFATTFQQVTDIEIIYDNFSSAIIGSKLEFSTPDERTRTLNAYKRTRTLNDYNKKNEKETDVKKREATSVTDTIHSADWSD